MSLSKLSVCAIVSALVAPMFAGVKFDPVFAPTPSFVSPVEEAFRKEICLNGTWQFQPVAVPSNFQEKRDPAPELTSPDPEKWEKTPIRIPSPWNVNSFADKNGQGGDFRCYPSYPKEWESVKMGWLRKSVTVPETWSGQRIYLRFNAVGGEANVIINGKSIGTHFENFLPFELDVTDSMKVGTANEILVGVRKSTLFDKPGDRGRRTYQGGSFWGQHVSGIWQDVYLLTRPAAHISDVFIQPQVDADTLSAEVTLVNSNSRPVSVTLGAEVFQWKSTRGKSVLEAPNPGGNLAEKPSLELTPAIVQVPANGEVQVTLSAKVNRQLQLWSPGNPVLYGLVTHVSIDGKKSDSRYVRFGWRQWKLDGVRMLLNGEPMVLKGDSWHFLGIPQMTRRYAWLWYKAMQDAGLNAVRLHAQPYPEFYLDVADEMGVMVLDETAIWASDGGPKLDDPAFWADSEKHVERLVRRDRNHPSVFGWSISNEVRPIVKGVMRNPPGMMEELVEHYGIWADICRKLDPTRTWISADGEEDGEGKLPTYIVHYGGTGAMDRGAKSGKPWGVGEAGNAYYGTPEQVAETNGDRAYESFLGRMEGVAASSYASLIAQRERNAVFRSVFNLVWYGLEPLPLGMSDTSKPPALEDGIFFTSFAEGRPGVQPERLGPYCTTLNPGYDPNLPEYKPWPLFEAIRDASAEPPIAGKWSQAVKPPPVQPTIPAKMISSAEVLSGGKLKTQLETMGVPLSKLPPGSSPELLFVDGTVPPDESASVKIRAALERGGVVWIWGVNPDSARELNALIPLPVHVQKREVSSLLADNSSSLTGGLSAASLYFSEQRPSVIAEYVLAGPLIDKSTALLKACDTDWLKWNKQPEFAKTGMVVRSEREAKPSGVVMAELQSGRGKLLITSLSPSPRLLKSEKLNRTLLANAGVPLEAGMDSGKPLLKSGTLVRALATGFFPVPSIKEGADTNPIDPAAGEKIRAGVEMDGKKWRAVFQESGVFDITKLDIPGVQNSSIGYFSFWVFSPRALDDLLLEPNLPAVTLETAQNDSAQVWLNGKQIISKIRTGPIEGGTAASEALKLHQGWNHFLIKLMRNSGGWNFTAKLISTQPDFLLQLDSALEKP